MEYRQGEGKNRVGNVEAKDLISMTHGHELKAWNAGGRECEGQREIKRGGNGTTVIAQSIKYILKKQTMNSRTTYAF